MPPPPLASTRVGEAANPGPIKLCTHNAPDLSQQMHRYFDLECAVIANQEFNIQAHNYREAHLQAKDKGFELILGDLASTATGGGHLGYNRHVALLSRGNFKLHPLDLLQLFSEPVLHLLARGNIQGHTHQTIRRSG